MSSRALQRCEGKFRTNAGSRSSIAALTPPPPSSVPLRDEVDSLLREKLDLHSELFEAAQIQRKLSGPRDLRGALSLRGFHDVSEKRFQGSYGAWRHCW